MVVDEKTIAAVRRYLNETIPEGGTAADTALSEEDIATIFETSESLYGAAAKGWRLKAASASAEPGQLKEYTIGQESYKKTTGEDYAAYCLEMARMFDEMAEKENAYGGSLILGVRRPRVV